MRNLSFRLESTLPGCNDGHVFKLSLLLKKVLIFIYAYSFNIHICIGDQIHLYHLLSNFTVTCHYSVCFYCLNCMFTKSVYCHMYVHRYGSIYWCVSSPSEPESLKKTDILPTAGINCQYLLREGWDFLIPPSSSLGFWRA